jgi:hypothetical protein
VWINLPWYESADEYRLESKSFSRPKGSTSSLSNVAVSESTMQEVCSGSESHRYCRGGFAPVHEELAVGSGGTELFLRTALTLRCCRAIGVCSTAALQTAITQRFSCWAVVSVLAEVIAKLFSGEEPVYLVAAVDDTNVRLNVLRQQPQRMGRPGSVVPGHRLGQTGPCRERLGPAEKKIVRWNPPRGVLCEAVGSKNGSS